MRSQALKHAVSILGLLVVVGGTPKLVQAAEPDWKAVEAALGKSGQAQPGGVYRIGMPRTDLAVTVKGVPVKAGFALGSYAAFKHAAALLHAFLGERRPRQAGRGTEGSIGSDQ